ncbi:MAG: ABC transporter permease [Muribaculaceae bacterium]|nr:ABC transporter permease [Muribaculaceae bacterium]
MNIAKGLGSTIRRELHRYGSRRVYLWAMVLVPLVCAFFFINLMSVGLPTKVPTAIVDLDNTAMSRNLTRSLGSTELIDLTSRESSYHDAVAKVQSGEIFGFFLIPEGFEADALGGRNPTLAYYSNMTYFVPGTLAFKGFKTMAVLSSGAVVETALTSAGLPGSVAETLLQPIIIDTHPLGNPWTNYSIYLSNSFIPGALELMIFLVTCFSICEEFKRRTSPRWLSDANGSIAVALAGKLLPATVIFTIIGWGFDALLFSYCHFPCAHLGNMLLAMPLFVIACQSFAVIVCSILANLRLSLSICSLFGILAFSIAGFSFPVDKMYGYIGIFSYILPVRWYFLIYSDQALNGIALFYSRYYYISLLIFPIVATLLAGRLRRRALHPVYVP